MKRAKVIRFPLAQATNGREGDSTIYVEGPHVVLELDAVPDRRFVLEPKIARQWARSLYEGAREVERTGRKRT